MNEGWVKLHRKLLENAIFYKPDYFQIWAYILLKVNHKDTEMIWNNEKKLLKKGSGIFSQKKISEEFKFEISKVNRILNYLKNENQITFIGFNKYTEIQVLKWEEYQDIFENGNQKETKRKPKRNPEETDKNDKNDKKDIIGECQKFISKYGQEMIDSFLNYWQEKDKAGKEKWEKQDTWETGRRLATWSKNNFSGKPKFSQKSNAPGGAII